MTDWIWHNGGPQPVGDEVWVEISTPPENQVQPAAKFNWKASLFYFRILNKRMIDAARLEGVRLGLEAAAKVAAEKVEKRIGVPCPDGVKGCLAFHFRREYHDKSAFHIAYDIRNLKPETIAKEAQHD